MRSTRKAANLRKSPPIPGSTPAVIGTSAIKPAVVHLPVLGPPRTSKIRRWRVATLIAVNLLILGHIAHSLLRERTLSPAVMSDSMRTLEMGEVTCGVLIFGGALLVSLIAGRFLCGWACHMGALQDLCAWVLKKSGHRPAPFRSRWLGYTPMALAAYMFVWPTFRRECVAPLLQRYWPEALAWIGPVYPFLGFSNRLVTDDFWRGLPTQWYVMVPFLLVCGGASVYFLGSRGLCRYGCPYAGLLDPAEKLAPVSITLDPDLCDQCGICTATCEVGVRVMEEVNQYGSVVNSRCIRSLDCISVCPQNALSLGFTTPAAIKALGGKRAKQVYSLTLTEELCATVAGLLTFFAMRGAYGLVPMLMAVGLAICTAAIAIKAGQLLRSPNVRFQSLQLKLRGSVRPAGWAFLAAFTLWTLVVAQAGAVRLAIVRADALASSIRANQRSLLSAGTDALSPTEMELARESLWWHALTAPLGAGGIAMTSTPDADLHAARLMLLAAQPNEAIILLRRVTAREGQTDPLTAELARATLLAGNTPGAELVLRQHVVAYPRHRESRQMLLELLTSSDRIDDSLRMLDRLVTADPQCADLYAERARLLAACEQYAPALHAAQHAAALAPSNVEFATDYLAFAAINADAPATDIAARQLRTAAGKDTDTRLSTLISFLEDSGFSAAASMIRRHRDQK